MWLAARSRPCSVGPSDDWFTAQGIVIHRQNNGCVSSVMMMSAAIGAYEAIYFDEVAQAVEFCHALVPHIVPQPGSPRQGDDRAVVWFHVPARSRSSTRNGCYLFASAGAIAAAQRAGLDAPLSGRVSRAALPPDVVLLFGEDVPPAPARTRRATWDAGRGTGDAHASLTLHNAPRPPQPAPRR